LSSVDLKEDIERSLQLRDHIDYQYLIQHQLLLVQRAFVDDNKEKVYDAIAALEAQTPDSWKDEQYSRDLKAAEVEVEIDIRPTVCGVKLSEKYCKEHGIPTTQTVKVINPFLKLRAIVNLWDRKGYTSKRFFVEEFTGERFHGSEGPIEDVESIEGGETK